MSREREIGLCDSSHVTEETPSVICVTSFLDEIQNMSSQTISARSELAIRFFSTVGSSMQKVPSRRNGMSGLRGSSATIATSDDEPLLLDRSDGHLVSGLLPSFEGLVAFVGRLARSRLALVHRPRPPPPFSLADDDTLRVPFANVLTFALALCVVFVYERLALRDDDDSSTFRVRSLPL